MISQGLHSNRHLAFLLTAAGTVLGLAGIDLVLPAIPAMPAHLGGGAEGAQFAIAAFVAGTASGLLIFGSIGPRFGRRQTLIAALSAYATLSLACALCDRMVFLVTLRFLQGVAASAPAVFAPSVIRSLYDDTGATKAFGVLGSIESLVPALAPAVGIVLLRFGGWTASFIVTSALAALLALTIQFVDSMPFKSNPERATGSYLRLLRSGVFLRYALSHAFVLGGLLIFVFGSPFVIVRTMQGVIGQFITMQIVGVACFIVSANATGFLVRRYGSELLILSGTLLAAGAALLILLYAIAGGRDPSMLIYLFFPMNIGLGLRGPPGFFQALTAGGGDDERAASMTILAIMAVSAAGTALLAPFIRHGLVALAAAATLSQGFAVIVLAFLPRFRPHADVILSSLSNPQDETP
jgi:DHA1 family bicyclomycin/chloramphenicol resistance-like MFS transporter